jgi:hypothetical protein
MHAKPVRLRATLATEAGFQEWIRPSNLAQ